MRAYEKVLTLDAQNLRRGRGADPALRGGQGRASARRRARDPARAHRRRGSAHRAACGASPSCREQRAQGQGGGLRLVPEGVRARTDAPTGRRAEAERLAQETGGFAELVERVRERRSQVRAPVRGAAAHVGGGARVRRASSASRTRRSTPTSQILEARREQRRRRSPRSSGCTSQTERYDELLGIYEKKLRAARRTRTRRRRSATRSPRIFEMEIKDNEQRDRRLPGRSSRTTATSCRRYRALDRIYVATQKWQRAVAGHLGASCRWSPPATTRRIVELKFRLGTRCETHLDDREGRHRSVPRHPRARAGPRRARAQALEKRLGEAEHQLGAAAHPRADLRAARRVAALIEVHEIQLSREKAASIARRPAAAHRRAAGGQDRRRREGVRRLRALLQGGSVATRRRAAELERLATINEALAAAGRRSTKRPSSSWRRPRATPALMRELLLKVADAYDEKLEKSDKAIEYFRRAQAIEPDDPSRARGAREALHAQREVAGAARGLSQEGRAHARRRRRASRSTSAWPTCGRRCCRTSTRRSRPTRRCWRRTAPTCKALKALDRLYLAQQQWHELADNLQRASSQLTDEPRDDPLLVRLAALRESQLGEVAAAVDTYRQVLELRAGERGATGALERLVQLTEHELQVATILEPIYKARNDWQKLVDDLRDPGAPLDGSGAQDRAAPPDRRAVRDRRRRRRPGVRHLRSRAARGAGPARRRRRASSGWRAARSLEGPGPTLYQAVAEQVTQVAGRRELQVQLLHARGADRGDAARRQRRGGGGVPRGAQGRRRSTSTRPTRSRRSISRTDAYHQAGRRACCAKVDMVRSVAEKKELLLQGGADLRGGAGERRSRDRRATARCCRIDENDRDGDRRARAALHPARALGAAQGRLRQEGGAGHQPRREEADAVRARAGLRPRARRTSTRAIETYQAILDLDREDVTRDPGARSALSAGRRAGTTCCRSSSARSSCRRRRARRFRSSTASASCGRRS